MLVIGITGTLGAGKGTVVEYLVEQEGFAHYSVREYIMGEVRRRKLPEDRDSLTRVANDLRALNHPAFIISELYHIAEKERKNCVIESIRNEGEVVFLRDHADFVLIAVDAPLTTRYERIRKRKSVTDQITMEVFRANEEREMRSADPGSQHLARCIELADYLIVNDGSVENLWKKTEDLMQMIYHRKK